MTAKLSAARAGTVQIGDRKVNRIGIGTNRVTDTEQTRGLLRRAMELGVDFIDTADVYQSGASEETIGKLLGSVPYHPLVTTKGGMIRAQSGLGVNGQPEHLRQAIWGSLRRLRLDYIELYQLHRVDPEVPIEASLEVLREAQKDGKIRHIGLSNVTVAEIERARQVATIVSVENQYNLLEREHDGVVDYCERHSIAFIPWFPILRGKLTQITVLTQVADRLKVTPYQLALSWLLKRSPIILPIPGTLSRAHLEENLGASDIDLNDDDFRLLGESSQTVGHA